MIALAAILSAWTPQAAREQHKVAPIPTRSGSIPTRPWLIPTRPTPIHPPTTHGLVCSECGDPVDHAGQPVRDGRLVVCFECGRCYCGAPAAHLEPLPRCMDHAAGDDFENDEIEDLDW